MKTSLLAFALFFGTLAFAETSGVMTFKTPVRLGVLNRLETQCLDSSNGLLLNLALDILQSPIPEADLRASLLASIVPASHLQVLPLTNSISGKVAYIVRDTWKDVFQVQVSQRGDLRIGLSFPEIPLEASLRLPRLELIDTVANSWYDRFGDKLQLERALVISVRILNVENENAESVPLINKNTQRTTELSINYKNYTTCLKTQLDTYIAK